jgi:hypothetical protein
LVVAGLLLIGLGRLLTDDSDRIPLFPSTTAVSDTVDLPSTTLPPTTVGGATPSTTVLARQLTVTDVTTVDPFGDGGENDDRVGNLVDGDPQTVWRTERYRDPLPLLKPGVGLAFTVEGDPREVVITGMNAGTSYEIAWAADEPDPGRWEVVFRGRVGTATPRHQLPVRADGVWIIWFTELPFLDVDDHSTQVAEVRFRA